MKDTKQDTEEVCDAFCACDDEECSVFTWIHVVHCKKGVKV